MITSIVQKILLSGRYQDTNGSAFLGLFGKRVFLYSLYESKDSQDYLASSFVSIDLTQFVEDEEVSQALSLLKSKAKSEWAYLRLTDDRNVMYEDFKWGAVDEIYEDSDHYRIIVENNPMVFSVSVGIDIPEHALNSIVDTGYVMLANKSNREKLWCLQVQGKYLCVTDGYRMVCFEFENQLTDLNENSKLYLPLLKDMSRSISAVLSISGYVPDNKIWNIPVREDNNKDLSLVIDGIMKHEKQQLFFQAGCVFNCYSDMNVVIDKALHTDTYTYAIPLSVLEDCVNKSLWYYKNLQDDDGNKIKVETVICEFEFEGLLLTSRTVVIRGDTTSSIFRDVREESTLLTDLGPECKLTSSNENIYNVDCKYLSSMLLSERSDCVVYFPASIRQPLLLDYGNGVKGLLMARRV